MEEEMDNDEWDEWDPFPVVDLQPFYISEAYDHEDCYVDLSGALCQWGAFGVIYHRIPEHVFKNAMDASLEFFQLPEEEKMKYEFKRPLDPIKYGKETVTNPSDQKNYVCREFLDIYVQPELHLPDKPQKLREAVLEMHTRTRPLHGLLIHLMATGRNMRVEGGVTEERFEMESCFRHFTANYYPSRPEFEEPIPMQPDTNQHVFFTTFMHNGEAGLEFSRVIYGERIPRNKWSRIRQAPPHAVLVHAGYPVEVYNNGYYRTVKLRAFVNTQAQPSITVGLSIGPGLNAMVRTAPEVEERSQKPSCYSPMKYIEIMEIMENNRLHGRIFDKEQVNYKAQQE
ncbi:leucoanthocyanidin dioxygenase [Sesamum indicum]|uniref:Leucoanthocyanidin dioxygenase n=2 Tax=Sesamum indicum TaxID=4182 RepID=A0A6I9UE37_SESIN|nr:leucoanthocyanidin dioxygenase [Sesamum indicum]